MTKLKSAMVTILFGLMALVGFTGTCYYMITMALQAVALLESRGSSATSAMGAKIFLDNGPMALLMLILCAIGLKFLPKS